MRYLFSIALAATICSAAAQAEVIVLTPTADSTVDALDPTTAFPTGHLEAAMVGEPGTVATELTFAFMQFQLPEGITGQDMESINSINLQIRRSSTAKLNLTYYVYAVFDGLDEGSADTYTWNSGVGYDPTHNEVRFPPNPDEISYYSDPGESAYIGFIDTSSSGPTDRPFGFVSDFFQGETALQNRDDALLQDTDGKITLYMKTRGNFETTPLQFFASLENELMIAPPTLTIDYVPGSGEEGIPGDYNGDNVVDAADYTIWRDTLGSTTDLRANGDNGGASAGVIDSADYDLWKSNFGVALGAGSGSQAVVPEPTSLTLMIGCASLLLTARRRGGR
jgi:hypothetical protein